MNPDSATSGRHMVQGFTGPLFETSTFWRPDEIVIPNALQGVERTNIVDLRAFRELERGTIAAAPESRIPWHIAVAEKLSEFANHQSGWDGYAGKPLRPEAGYFAFRVLIDVMSGDTPQPILVPTSSGGVQMEWHAQGWDIEVDIEGAYDGEVWGYEEASGHEIEFDLSTGDTARLAKVLETISVASGAKRSLANAG